MTVRLVPVRSLGDRADLSPAALRSPNQPQPIPLINQLNSLKTPREFATPQGYDRSGSAALPVSGGNPKYYLT